MAVARECIQTGILPAIEVQQPALEQVVPGSAEPGYSPVTSGIDKRELEAMVSTNTRARHSSQPDMTPEEYQRWADNIYPW